MEKRCIYWGGKRCTTSLETLAMSITCDHSQDELHEGYWWVTTVVTDFWNSSLAPRKSTWGCCSSELLVLHSQVSLNMNFFTDSRLNLYTLNPTKIQGDNCIKYKQIDME